MLLKQIWSVIVRHFTYNSYTLKDDNAKTIQFVISEWSKGFTVFGIKPYTPYRMGNTNNLNTIINKSKRDIEPQIGNIYP